MKTKQPGLLSYQDLREMGLGSLKNPVLYSQFSNFFPSTTAINNYVLNSTSLKFTTEMLLTVENCY